MLPVQTQAAQLKLGEGVTPLTCAQALGNEIGCSNTLIKDESFNPTGSFKARGLVMAVGRAYELGAAELAIPSAGNAAGAMSAYAAKARLPAHVYMPQDVPVTFRVECSILGAEVTLVDGLNHGLRGQGEREGRSRMAGSMSARSRSRIGSRAKRRWAMRSSSS